MIEHTSGKSPLCEFNFIAHYETIIKATHVCNLFFFYTCTLKQGFLQVLPQTPYRITPCQFSLFFFLVPIPFLFHQCAFFPANTYTHTYFPSFIFSSSHTKAQRRLFVLSFLFFSSPALPASLSLLQHTSK